jgi:hypothetical protein
MILQYHSLLVTIVIGVRLLPTNAYYSNRRESGVIGRERVNHTTHHFSETFSHKIIRK